MRPLNRPMFKMGGPIKEGIMSGIKDNRQALNTVGSPIFPKGPDGRAQHALQAGAFLFPIVQGIRTFGMRAIPKVASLFRTQVGTRGPGTVKIPGKPGTKGRFLPQNVKTVEKSGPSQPIFQPNIAGRILGQDPTVRTIGSIIKGVTNPAVKGPVASAARLVFSPTGVLTGLYYANGKFFNKDTNEEVPPPANADELILGDRVGTSGAPGGGDPNMFLEPKKTKVDTDKLTKDRIDATKERYYKLMGLDDMKKDAVYDSLIDASKIIQEEGADLKGALKSGTLQNRIIQAISGQLDKSAALKRQIDAAVLKGEIQKDIAGAKPGSYLKQAEDYAAMKNVSVSQAYKDLGFDKRGDLNEGVQLYLKANKVAPAGADLATLARSYDIDIAGIEDTTTVKNKIKEKGYDEIGYLTEVLSNPNAQVAPGNYVINNRVLNVDADKNITPVF